MREVKVPWGSESICYWCVQKKDCGFAITPRINYVLVLCPVKEFWPNSETVKGVFGENVEVVEMYRGDYRYDSDIK